MAINLKKPNNKLPLLPPKQSLVETIAILKQESKSAAALAELKGLAQTLPNPKILINAIVLKEAQASSEIENVVTTQDKLYQALYAKSDKPDAATKEVLRYREALLLGHRTVQKSGLLTTNTIIEIQKELEENNAGLRKLPGTALVNDLTNEVIYTPPDNLDTIVALMTNLEIYYNTNEDTISPLIKMAVQHYQFESIHPFYDGNGRTGRIINVLYLILAGCLDEPILYLSSYIINNKSDYYRLLQEVRTKKNWEEWIMFMLIGIEKTALSTIKQIKEINTLFTKTQKLVQKKLPSIYSKDLIEQLFVNPYCKNEFLVENLKIERKTAARYLNQLVEIGILETQQSGKETIYINILLYKLLRTGS